MIQRIKLGKYADKLRSTYKSGIIKNDENTILSGNRNKLQCARVSEESINIIRDLRKSLFEKDPEFIYDYNTIIKKYEVLGNYKSFYGSGAVLRKNTYDGTEVILAVNKDNSLFSVEIANKKNKCTKKFDVAYETTKEPRDMRIGEILDYNDLYSRFFADNNLSKRQTLNKFINGKPEIINIIDKLIKKYL